MQPELDRRDREVLRKYLCARERTLSTRLRIRREQLTSKNFFERLTSNMCPHDT